MAKLMMGWMAAVLLTAASPAAAVTRCVQTGSWECYISIQIAVNLSAPGDVVEVRAGTYFENVYIEPRRVGVQIVGPMSGAPAIVDASSKSDERIIHNEPGFTVVAPGVVLRDLSIYNGASDGIRVEAPNVVVERVTILNPRHVGIRIPPGVAGARLLSNSISGAGTGIDIQGPDALVDGNQVSASGRGIIVARGDRVALTKNVISGGEQGIEVQGESPLIKGNRLSNLWDVGIHVRDSGDPVVEGNDVRNTTRPILLSCARCQNAAVATNEIVNSPGLGIYAIASDAGLEVRGNTVQNGVGGGLRVQGDDVQVEGNRVYDSGFEDDRYVSPCVWVSGNRNVVRSNSVTRCAATGVDVDGATAYVATNVVLDSYNVGFRVRGQDMQLVSNRARTTSREGFRNEATALGVSYDHNIATSALTGFCDNGSGTRLGSNAFESVGTCMF